MLLVVASLFMLLSILQTFLIMLFRFQLQAGDQAVNRHGMHQCEIKHYQARLQIALFFCKQLLRACQQLFGSSLSRAASSLMTAWLRFLLVEEKRNAFKRDGGGATDSPKLHLLASCSAAFRLKFIKGAAA